MFYTCTLVESPHQHYSHCDTHEHDILCEARREQWCYSYSQYLSSYTNIGYSVEELHTEDHTVHSSLL